LAESSTGLVSIDDAKKGGGRKKMTSLPVQ